MLLEYEGGHGFVHRNFECRALAGPAALEQGGRDGARRDLPDNMIDGQEGRVTRCSVPNLRQAGNSAGTLKHGVVGRSAAIGTTRPKSGNQAMDQVWLAGQACARIQTQPFKRFGANVRYEDVAACDQLVA